MHIFLYIYELKSLNSHVNSNIQLNFIKITKKFESL